MRDWLVAPGGWLAPFMVAGALLIGLGAMMQERVRSSIAGFRRAPGAWTIRQRIIAGHVAGVPLAAIAAYAAQTTPESMQRTMFWGLALLLYLACAWVLPRRPLVREQQVRKKIRALLPSFLSFLLTQLYGVKSRPEILLLYVNRADARLEPMQEAVRSALHLVHERNALPFEALHTVAVETQIPEFIDVTQLLAQAERTGSDVRHVLDQSATLIAQVLDSEFRQMIERRKLYLLAFGAFSVVGILVQILFVIVIGGGVLDRF